MPGGDWLLLIGYCLLFIAGPSQWLLFIRYYLIFIAEAEHPPSVTPTHIMKLPDNNLDQTLAAFHDQVKLSFAFLQRTYKMRRARMKLNSMVEPRDARAGIWYSGDELDVVVSWSIYETHMGVSFLNARHAPPPKPRRRARSITDVGPLHLTDVVRFCTDGKVRFSLERMGMRRFQERKQLIDSQMRMLVTELAQLCQAYARPILEGDHEFMISVANAPRD